jgi:hypothetical protein
MPNIKRDAKKNAALKYHGLGSIHATTATSTTITARMRVSTPAVIDDLGSSIDVCPKAPRGTQNQGKSGSPCSRFELATTLPKVPGGAVRRQAPQPMRLFCHRAEEDPRDGQSDSSNQHPPKRAVETALPCLEGHIFPCIPFSFHD